VHRPSITVYLPAKHTGVSVIVVPGGGHRELWTDHEGHAIARFLNERGIAAFVLYYRLDRGNRQAPQMRHQLRFLHPGDPGHHRRGREEVGLSGSIW